jgi:4-amino-4-deoxy-L-arabinose transferase-like glycosyltransferase
MPRVLAIGAAAILVRVLFVFWLHPPNHYVHSDMLMFVWTALQEFQGSDHPFISLQHGLLTHTLRGSFALFGPGNTQVYWTQVLWSSGSVFLTYLLARRLLSPGYALAACIYQAGNVLDIGLAGYWLSEAGFTCFLLATLWALARWRESPRHRPLWASLAGALLAVQILARENALLTVPFLVAWMLLSRSGPGPVRLRDVALLLGVCALVLLPQALRNRELIGAALPATSRGPRYLAYSALMTRALVTHDSFGVGAIVDPLFERRYPVEPVVFSEREEFRAEPYDGAFWWGVAWEALKRRPETLLWHLQNFFFIWALPPWPAGWEGGWLGWLSAVWNLAFALVVAPLYLLQLRPRFWRDPLATLLNLVVISLWLYVYVGFGQARFRAPYDPLLLILALRSLAGPGVSSPR